MRALVQRVSEASVRVGGDVVGEIGPGLCVLLGVTHADRAAEAAALAAKVWHLRVFEGTDGRMDLPVAEVGGEVLVVSQFTLAGDTSRGNRPGYSAAAAPAVGEQLYEHFVEALSALDVPVKTGQFGADMAVELLNDGPVTILYDL